ncbi:ATP synthase F1 subunit delta [Sediminicola arcticus]|jgi:F-type H+-transporting ATPase subunit delta|uniref:ATP synthase subunit delta n=1 Tax=Sediminicola arcticus TaxID=1574308 RepID=A0ABV2SQZ9_9FLAO
MNESRAAIRYAKAILDLAVDNKSTDAVEKDMRSVLNTLADSKELQTMMASPVVSSEAKKNVLLEVFKGSNTITTGLIDVLVTNKRINLLNNVAEKYIILNEKLKGEGVAFVTTAVPLSVDLEKKILAKIAGLTTDKVVVQNTVDESIIGGFVLRIGDMQLDSSIATKLSNLKREFTNSL